MRSKYVSYALAGLLAIAAVPMSAADHPQKPGKWQVKMTMEIPGVPFKMPPVTTEICLTEEDLANPDKAVPKDAKKDCKVGDYKVDGNTVSWTMECPKDKIKGSGEITYTDTSYTGSMEMSVGEQQMTTKYSGKWLGECSK